MIPDLARRNEVIRERMDDPGCDTHTLERTYAQFGLVNRVVSGWRTIYRRDIRPRCLEGPLRIVDIGAGAGDVARSLIRWARRDHLTLEIVAVDPEERAADWVERQPPIDGLVYRRATSADLVARGETFDVVMSNHLLHHLNEAEFNALLDDSRRLVTDTGVVIHGDIARSYAGYWAFALGTLPFRPTLLCGSYIRHDGLLSIRRAYTIAELTDRVPSDWTVRAGFPSRLELRLEQPRAGH